MNGKRQSLVPDSGRTLASLVLGPQLCWLGSIAHRSERHVQSSSRSIGLCVPSQTLTSSVHTGVSQPSAAVPLPSASVEVVGFGVVAVVVGNGVGSGSQYFHSRSVTMHHEFISPVLAASQGTLSQPC